MNIFLVNLLFNSKNFLFLYELIIIEDIGKPKYFSIFLIYYAN
ncbi:MAG: hypothetical protein Q8830_01740 [Candidatus Phytoplasma australasiaticum]|nr:hypothetical protein [Candidatus Phytoplasma australasiaticum]